MSMAKRPHTLRAALAALAVTTAPPRPPAANAFEFVVWENVAYLASPARRREAFDELRRTVDDA
jgi:hypothetical protein